MKNTQVTLLILLQWKTPKVTLPAYVAVFSMRSRVVKVKKLAVWFPLNQLISPLSRLSSKRVSTWSTRIYNNMKWPRCILWSTRMYTLKHPDVYYRTCMKYPDVYYKVPGCILWSTRMYTMKHPVHIMKLPGCIIKNPDIYYEVPGCML